MSFVKSIHKKTVTVELPLAPVNILPAAVDQAPAEVPTFSSPLVQVIVNINKESPKVPEVPVLDPEIVAEPEDVITNPIDVISVNPAGLS
ncbi:unnamed protein product [Leptidea sinapis]|uniref:Uncharacterized protein n=1 Tax=Leptidea sinapis TaxID=189913 RepID=A0A5E4QHI4_9NEOP|nr:unnamed protein product [Leptidea sinapis]